MTEQPVSLETLTKRLRALPSEVSGHRGGPLRVALYAVAKELRSRSIQRVPVGSGRLRRAIVIVRDKQPQRTNRANERYLVSVRSGRSRDDPRGAYYGSIVHYGTSPGKRGPSKARRFIGDAWNSMEKEAITIFTDNLAKGMDRALARAKRAR